MQELYPIFLLNKSPNRVSDRFFSFFLTFHGKIVSCIVIIR